MTIFLLLNIFSKNPSSAFLLSLDFLVNLMQQGRQNDRRKRTGNIHYRVGTRGWCRKSREKIPCSKCLMAIVLSALIMGQRASIRDETENLKLYCLYRQYTQSYLLCNATYNRICLILNNNRRRPSSATVWVLKCKEFSYTIIVIHNKMQKIFQKFKWTYTRILQTTGKKNSPYKYFSLIVLGLVLSAILLANIQLYEKLFANN